MLSLRRTAWNVLFLAPHCLTPETVQFRMLQFWQKQKLMLVSVLVHNNGLGSARRCVTILTSLIGTSRILMMCSISRLWFSSGCSSPFSSTNSPSHPIELILPLPMKELLLNFGVWIASFSDYSREVSCKPCTFGSLREFLGCCCEWKR